MEYRISGRGSACHQPPWPWASDRVLPLYDTAVEVEARAAVVWNRQSVAGGDIHWEGLVFISKFAVSVVMSSPCCILQCLCYEYLMGNMVDLVMFGK